MSRKSDIFDINRFTKTLPLIEQPEKQYLMNYEEKSFGRSHEVLTSTNFLGIRIPSWVYSDVKDSFSSNSSLNFTLPGMGFKNCQEIKLVPLCQFDCRSKTIIRFESPVREFGL